MRFSFFIEEMVTFPKNGLKQLILQYKVLCADYEDRDLNTPIPVYKSLHIDEELFGNVTTATKIACTFLLYEMTCTKYFIVFC